MPQFRGNLVIAQEGHYAEGVPPPRFHLTRFHGVLAPHSTLRPLVVLPAPVPDPPLQLPLFEQPAATSDTASSNATPTKPPYKGRHPWAQLLRHVFAADVTRCAHCKARMRLLELCTTPDAIARAMARAGLGPQPPPAPPHHVHPSQLSLLLR